MAMNFEKTLALVAENAAGGKVKLGDIQMNELLNLYGSPNDPLIVYGTSIPAAVPVLIGKGASLTYMKNTIAPLISGDAVYQAQANAAKVEPVTIYLNSHLGNQEELTSASVNAQGLATWTATKLSNYLPQILREKTRKGFDTIIASSAEITVAAKAAGETVRDYGTRVLQELVATALKMSKTKDLNQGIDTYGIDNIVITGGPKLVSIVMAAGLQGNMTEKAFGNGVINELRWGGIRFQFSELLDNADAIIGTSFLGKSPMIPVAMYAGPKTLNGIMYEARAAVIVPGKDKAATTGFEFIYKNKLADKTKPDFKTDFIISSKVTLA